MVHLGTFDVPIQFTPPDHARPGDEATVRFKQSSMRLALPADWIPGQPVLCMPASANPLTATTSLPPRQASIPWDKILGIGTACIGVCGLIAGCTYVGAEYPGTSGFALSVLLAVAAAGSYVAFEWYCKVETTFSQLHPALLSLAFLFTSATMGSAFVQGIANANHRDVFSLTLMAWLSMHVLLQLGFVLYTVSLARLGQPGLKVRASFLPWFTIGAPSIIVMWAAIGLLSSGGGRPTEANFPQIAHCVACFQTLVVAIVAFVTWKLAVVSAPPVQTEEGGSLSQRNSFTRLQGADPSHSTGSAQYAPGLLMSLAVMSLCILCIQDLHPSHEDHDAVVRSFFYALGFVVVLALPTYGLDGMLVLHAVTFLSLAALIGTIMVARSLGLCGSYHCWALAVESWVLLLLASVVPKWHLFSAISRGRPSVAECPHGEEGDPGLEVAFGENLRDGTLPAPVAALTKNGQGGTRCLLGRNIEDYIHLFGSLFLFIVCTSFLGDPLLRSLAMALPVGILISHAMARPVHCSVAVTFKTILAGFIVCALPLRLMIVFSSDPIGDWVYEVSLLVYPCGMCVVAYLELSRASNVQKENPDDIMFAVFLTALCLMCLERIAPLGLIGFGLVAFTLSYRSGSLWSMAISIIVWEIRGGISAQSRWDLALLSQETSTFMVGLGAVIMVLLCLFKQHGFTVQNYSDDSSVLLLALIPVPSFFCALTGGYLSLLLGVLSMAYGVLHMTWLTSVAAILLVAFSVSAGDAVHCWAAPCDGRCAHPLRLTQLGVAVASLSALVLAVRAAQVKSKGNVVGVTWAAAFILAFPASLHDYPWFPIIHVSWLTCTMLFSAWPWTYSWCALPGLWALCTPSWYRAWPGHFPVSLPLSSQMTSACAGGVLLLALVWYPRLRHGHPGSGQPLAFPVELAGVIWVMVGASLGPFRCLGHFGQIGAITVLIALGAAQLVLGLSINSQDRWRRIIGLLSIILAIVLCASATKGLVQGVITLAGSLVAIALAALVAFAQPDKQTDSGNDASAITVELQGPGGGI